MFLKVIFVAGLACQFLPGGRARCSVSRRSCSNIQPYCKGADVVNRVVNTINGLGIFPPDHKFLCRIAWVETKYGEHPNTFPDGYYGGIWRVDRIGHEETQRNTVLQGYWDQLKTKLAIDWQKTRWEDLVKPLYSGLAARLYIATVPSAIPTGLSAQASYWKRYYNTAAGGGTVQGFINDVNSAHGCAR